MQIRTTLAHSLTLRHWSIFVLSFIFLNVITFTGCSGSKDAASDAGKPDVIHKKRTLKVVSFYTLNMPILGEDIIYLADRLDQATEGGITLKPYNPGALVAPMEILDAVSSGKVEAGYASAGFWSGTMPAAPLFSSVPFGPGTDEFLAWLYFGNGLKLYQEMYDHYGYDIKVLVCAMIPPETSGWFARPIEKPEDLQGLKIRFYGLGGEVMKRLGASVEVLPGAEVFPALERGMIQATEYSLPVIDESLGFYKLVKYNYYPGWHQQSTSFELLINKQVWESLPESTRIIMEMACRDAVIESISRGEGMQSAIMKKNEEERGVVNATWSPEMLELFEKTWLETVAEMKAGDEFFNKVWNDYESFRRDYKIWKDKAYLK